MLIFWMLAVLSTLDMHTTGTLHQLLRCTWHDSANGVLLKLSRPRCVEDLGVGYWRSWESQHASDMGPVHAQDRVGINVKLLDDVQTKLLALYAPLQGPGDPLTQHPSTIFQESVTATLYNATMRLLDDLHNNCRMLGVPERYRKQNHACTQSPCQKLMSNQCDAYTTGQRLLCR